MLGKDSHRRLPSSLKKAIAALSFSAIVATLPVNAQDSKPNHNNFFFWPGNLVVSRSVYDSNPNNVQVGQILPPNCTATTGGCSAATGAPFNGTYPFVWNNDTYDASFGITSKIYLDQMFPFGFVLNSLEVPNRSQRGIKCSSDQMVTSFSSKSELALNLSTDGRYLTFAGYIAPIDQLEYRIPTRPVPWIRPIPWARMYTAPRHRWTSLAISSTPKQTPTAATMAGP